VYDGLQKYLRAEYERLQLIREGDTPTEAERLWYHGTIARMQLHMRASARERPEQWASALYDVREELQSAIRKMTADLAQANPAA